VIVRRSMMRISKLGILILPWVLCALPVQAQVHPQDGNLVVKAAKKWLALIDSEDYETAWEQSSKILKEKTSQQAWVVDMMKFRKKIGLVKTRGILGLNRQPKKGIKPHAGILYFSSQYKNCDIPHETLYIVFENGTWKVAGYYAKLERSRP